MTGKASDKKAEERTVAEQKAAEATAVAKVKQEEFEANLKRNEDAAKLAAKNDDKKSDTEDIGFTDRAIAAKLQEASSPMAAANEREDYVLKQQLYQQAGLSAPEVLATASDKDSK